jgi:NAD+ kinase
MLPTYLPEELDRLPGGDIVLVLGGDGTFLAGARVAAHHNIPVIGVELGHLGFLCQQPLERLPRVLECVRKEECSIESRHILECQIVAQKAPGHTRTAVNDVVVGKSELTRMAVVTVFIDGEVLATFKADGIIVASATGSTAYSLSAGGPLLEPTMKAMVITPICAHTLFAKPFVVEGRRTVGLRVEKEIPDIFLSMDGRKIGPVRPEDEVSVTIHRPPLKVARLESPNFLQVLREKFGWGFEFKRENC